MKPSKSSVKIPRSDGKKGKPNEAGWHTDFLQFLAEIPNVSRAARMAGVTKRTAYDHKEKFPLFAQAWTEALDTAIDEMAGSLYQRATVGVPKTRFGSEGREVTEQEYDTTAAIFLLKAHRPEVYGDKVSVTQTQKIAVISPDQLLAEANAGLENILKTIMASQSRNSFELQVGS